VAADQEFAIRLIDKGAKVEFFPEVVYNHAAYSHSITWRKRKQWRKDKRKLARKYLNPYRYILWEIGNAFPERLGKITAAARKRFW
jgi:hypothetical protein